ncbi:MAG: lysine 5,6-aminomutase subunit alpha [bacterium]|nr:lysine 5,6-aminomutase subunit alpha [bacterium]
MSKLNLDRDKIESCRLSARKITQSSQDFVDRHTSVSVERATLRLLGLEDTLKGKPVANLIVDQIPKEKLGLGASYWFGRALAGQRSGSPLSLALRIADGKIDLMKTIDVPLEKIQKVMESMTRRALSRLEAARQKRQKQLDQFDRTERPLKYVQLQRETFEETITWIKILAAQGVDGFEVSTTDLKEIRTLRTLLDEIGQASEKYIRLSLNPSPLSGAETSVMAAVENVDAMTNDPIKETLFDETNLKRALVDQAFARRVLARSGMTVNTAENFFLLQADVYRCGSQILASQFINEQLAVRASLPETQLGLRSSYDLSPALENGLLCEIAQSQMTRDIFPKAPLQNLSPTRNQTGDPFFEQAQTALFGLVSVLTEQDVQLFIDAPSFPLQDSLSKMKNAHFLFKSARHLGDEIYWSANGKLIRRARTVLEETLQILKKIEGQGLTQAFENGSFVRLSRPEAGGHGADGIIRKESSYFNPLFKELEKETETAMESRETTSREERPSRPQRDQKRKRYRGRRRPSRGPTEKPVENQAPVEKKEPTPEGEPS